MNTAAQYAKRKLIGLVNRFRVLFLGLSSHPVFRRMENDLRFFHDATEIFFQETLDAAVSRNRPGTFSRNSPGIGVYGYDDTNLPRLANHAKRVLLPEEVDEFVSIDVAFIWGHAAHKGNVATLCKALPQHATIVLCEDGFIKSADTWANRNIPEKYRRGCSLLMDTKGFHFDATVPTNLEDMLNDRSLLVSQEEREHARNMIRKIVDNRITKYNHQPMRTIDVGRPGKRKVLVVDQSYGDFSILRGWADESTFASMLQSAIVENPDADILVKTHPDTMAGARKGYYDNVKEEGNVYRVTIPVNPYSLMDLVDKVYVCSTQFGLEALLAGKEVHVFGMPFYAGWGLTVDAQENPRRTNTRSLEELFHIFYVRYTNWLNPETGEEWTIDQAVDHMISLRSDYSEYRQRQNGTK